MEEPLFRVHFSESSALTQHMGSWQLGDL